MNDKEFWLIIKRALMMVVKAIERKYPTKEARLEDGDGTVSYAVIEE